MVKNMATKMRGKVVRVLPLLHYVEKALKIAEYYRDENGVVIAKVP